LWGGRWRARARRGGRWRARARRGASRIPTIASVLHRQTARSVVGSHCHSRLSRGVTGASDNGAGICAGLDIVPLFQRWPRSELTRHKIRSHFLSFSRPVVLFYVTSRIEKGKSVHSKGVTSTSTHSSSPPPSSSTPIVAVAVDANQRCRRQHHHAPITHTTPRASSASTMNASSSPNPTSASVSPE
jgi:hypothetical protein